MKLFGKLHSKLGDFWWYSLMLFCACRAADLLHAFVGLWIVPKYVDPVELGAVMPLANFANFLAIPLIAFANTFRNELMRLSVEQEFGKLKTLMRGVFVATAIFLILAIIVSRLFLPLFLERIRLAEGSLGLIIIAVSFVGAAAPIYTNALQAMKKFKTLSLLNILGAPVRLLAMLIAMPFRAISGYFIGQVSSPLFSIATSFVALKKELSVPAKPYWNADVLKKFSGLFAIFLSMAIAGGVYALTESTTIRQRLPDLDSAGYYMASRFSDIASFLFSTLVVTIFPFAADKIAKGENVMPMMLKSTAVSIGFCVLVAIPFAICGKTILSLLPHGEQYATYWWAIPWLIGITALGTMASMYATVNISANRFGFLKWYLPIDIIYPILLLLVTGHGYFAGIIPASWTAFLVEHNIYALDTMLCWMTAITFIKFFACAIAIARNYSKADAKNNMQ
jgi:O-antigen/teichoic acid export membrane protein